jgi:chemotaxis protein methyltransferase CheR
MNVTDENILQFNSALKANSQYDLSEYSEKSLKRRIAKILADNKMDFAVLLSELRRNKEFIEKTVKDITVNTTELFRDPPIWHSLKYKILPRYQNSPSLTIWHAGCSTGQEVYSMMILLHELGMLEKAKIYGSDINTDVLGIAAKGIYKYRFNIAYLDNFDKVIRENPYNFEEFKEIPYSKYFEIDKTRDQIRMHQFLVDKPLFKKHDLVKEENPFFTKFDLIICRNVIIYFNYDLQNKLFSSFHRQILDGGYLILGVHESILGPHTSLFEKKDLIYYKK